MDSVIRAAVVYLVLMALFRLSGRRTLAEMGSFDFVMLLVISETVQNALTDADHSMTNAFLLVATFILIDVGLSLWKQRSRTAVKLLDGVPMVIVEDGKPLRAQMDRARIGEEDVLHAARQTQGLERMDQIKFAVLETSGGISIIPKQPAA